MAITPVRLQTLTQAYPLVDRDGRLTNEGMRRLNDSLTSITYALNQVLNLPGLEDAIADAQAAAEAAQTAADSANSAAATANTAADDAASATALANSYVDGLTVSAADAGASVTITISAHNRTYATTPPTTVAVTGGALTGVPYSTMVYGYYDQASRLGGAVTYQFTTDIADVAQINNRHSVFSVMTPAALAAPSPGNPVTPPGGNYDIP